MHKTLIGKVVSTKMQETVVVEVSYKKPHPMYQKLLKRSKKYKVAPNGHTVSVGDTVVKEETRQVAKGKYFKIIDVRHETHGVVKRKENTDDTTQK